MPPVALGQGVLVPAPYGDDQGGSLASERLRPTDRVYGTGTGVGLPARETAVTSVLRDLPQLILELLVLG